jgi:ribitol-5-phosphate 2-dehydrogenase (NADP+) / D-ribitol-5-phosphate cytidylyltransferase
MRVNAFGEEPTESLLQPGDVAYASLDALISAETGHVIDVRRIDPLQAPIEKTEAAGTGTGPRA